MVTTALVTNKLLYDTCNFYQAFMAIVTPYNEPLCKTETCQHSKVIEVEGSNNQ